MVRPIKKDITCLQMCEDCTSADRILFTNMFETFRETKEEIGYLSANMIGENKRIFMIYHNLYDWVFINPTIVRKEGPYDTAHICYYHKALRSTKRYESIDVEFFDTNFEMHIIHFEGEMAGKIQHMMDHINGIRM